MDKEAVARTLESLQHLSPPRVQECFGSRSAFFDAASTAWFRRIELLRKNLNTSAEEISTIDHGSGPRQERLRPSNGQPRVWKTSLGALCQRRSATAIEGRALFWLIRQLQPERVIELGTALGISAAYQAAALETNGSGVMTTVEGCPQLAAKARAGFEELGLTRVSVVAGRFQDVLPELLPSMSPLDFAFIDGHHEGPATLNYFTQIAAAANRGAVVVIDDIAWSPEVAEAWNQIRSAPGVVSSIELLSLGMIALEA